MTATSPAVAGPCPARAEVGGDAAAVARVTTELERLGVQRGPAAPGCRGIVAHVELEVDGGIAVAIRDGARRSEGRVVSDAAMAASWIDSWLRDDLDGTAWLLASATPSATTPAIAPPTARPDAPASEPTGSGPGSGSVFDRFAITAGYEQSWLADGATAAGASVAACAQVGRACIGGRARFAREDDRVVNLTAMSRGDVSVFAVASVPFAIGRMTLAPELGLGVGRTTTKRIESCEPQQPPNCDPSDPMDPNCMMQPTTCIDANGTSTKVYVGDELEAATFTPRIAGALRISVPLFDHVWLDGLASFTFGPFGHADPFGVTINPDGTVPGNVSPADVALPGEAGSALVFGVGLRVGTP